MDKPIKFEIPQALLPYLSDDPEKEIKILLVFELYREKKITIRQGQLIFYKFHIEKWKIFSLKMKSI
ncbi:MAG: hypothetical protein EU529_09105 [Promethearchaeota archaeon]|nr:MAG: hypothetical protein EU529_09105 [Candidatus Lokiarchaeota archaeon]